MERAGTREPGASVGSCGQQCWQIYSTQSAIWVPTQDRLIRIDQAKSSG
jgi:hypothetical protein